MGYLSLPYRVGYESRGLISGLTNIQALVLKPDLSIAGPYILREMPAAFNGLYCFDFMSAQTDPEGEYMALIFSPTEQSRIRLKFSLFQRPLSQAYFDQKISEIETHLDEIDEQLNFISVNVI